MAIGRARFEGTPFPQADNPFKVIGVVNLASNCKTTDDDKIASEFDMVGRQGAYYGNAAAYLDLVVDRGGYWKLTKAGTAFVALTKSQQEKALADAILALPVFDYAAEYFAIMGETPDASELLGIIQKEDSRVNDTTASRRASTVNGWIEMVAQTVPQAIKDVQDTLNAE